MTGKKENVENDNGIIKEPSLLMSVSGSVKPPRHHLTIVH